MESNITFLVRWVGGWVGWWLGEWGLEIWRVRLTKAKVEVEVEAELGKNHPMVPPLHHFQMKKRKS